MKRSILFALVPSVLLFGVSFSALTNTEYTYVKASIQDLTLVNDFLQFNETATVPLPDVANYRRTVTNADYKEEDHIYRVCNGKNKAKCGFWENVKTKKKVASGPTIYNKNKKALIVKQIRETDFGTYMTGNKKKSYDVLRLNVKG